MTLRCESCPFRGDFTASVRHHEATGHFLTVKGVRQDFRKVIADAKVLGPIQQKRHRAAMAQYEEEQRLRGQRNKKGAA